MSIPKDQESLAKLFAKLGAPDPDSWASSQISEGIDQLHRFLFLRQAWSSIISDDNTDWVNTAIERLGADPTGPYAGVAHALSRCVEKGVNPQDLTDIVRGMQAQLLFNFCYLLEDPSLTEGELSGVGWCLVTTDDDWQPTSRQITGLHESVLETDPTGREMRPRDT